MTKIEIKGPIIDNTNGEFMSYFGDDNYAYPSKVKKELSNSSGDLIVEINSPGGYTAPAAEIYTDLKSYDGNVEVHIVGEADSAASIIAMAGDKVLMSPMAMMMIHRAMSSADGNTDDLASGKQALDELDQNIVNAYALKTGKDKQDIYNLMAKTTWMNAKTAVREGFADGIMQFDDVKQNQIAEPMLNSVATTIPNFDAQKIMHVEKLLSNENKDKKDDHAKLVNSKLGILFGGK